VGSIIVKEGKVWQKKVKGSTSCWSAPCAASITMSPNGTRTIPKKRLK